MLYLQTFEAWSADVQDVEMEEMTNIIDMKRRNLNNAERRRQQFANSSKVDSNGHVVSTMNNVNPIQVRQHRSTNGQVLDTSNF